MKKVSVEVPVNSNTAEQEKYTQRIAIVKRLNNILYEERRHFTFYQHSCAVIRGVERLYLLPFLQKEMMSELEHIRLFSDKIVAYGGMPDILYDNFLPNNLTRAQEILQKAIELEQNILTIYHEVYSQAEKYAEIAGDMSVVLMLEEQIEHSTADMEEMQKMLEMAELDKVPEKCPTITFEWPNISDR